MDPSRSAQLMTRPSGYEILPGNGQDYTYGGRAGVKLFDNTLKAGGSYIHEGQGDQSGNLYGVDTSYKLNQKQHLINQSGRNPAKLTSNI